MLTFVRLVYDVVFQVGKKRVAVVRMDLKNNGFAEIETENAEKRLRVDYESAATKVDVVRVLAHDRNEFFNAFRKAERDLTDFIDNILPDTYIVNP